MTDFIQRSLEELKSRNLYRQLKVVDGEQDATVRLDGREVLNLSSNNYLGLANHPALKEAAREALDRYGCGSGASRLISGNMTAHEELERRIARFKGTEAALVFNSGYQANVGIIATLVEKDDLVLSDQLNHASIIDGCRLSRAAVSVYRHCDMDHLESLLKDAPANARKLIVTESIFSMDGDIVPLREMVELAERYGAMVMVDEAHATGVRGPNGAGVVAELGLGDRVLVQMGTLGKALGAFGAYAAGSARLRELLINRARSFIFTTSLPPVVLAMAGAAVDLVEKEPARQCALHRNAGQLRNGLQRLGYAVGGSTQIIPVMVGEEQPCMQLAARLLESGFYVQGIRPPTVPPGTSRLRVTTMATHTAEQMEQALHAFEQAGRESVRPGNSNQLATGAAGTGERNEVGTARALPTSGREHESQQRIPDPEAHGPHASVAPLHPDAGVDGRKPLHHRRGRGQLPHRRDGNRYLDGVSSLWCNLFGHRRPELDQALKAQTDRIAHSTFLGLSHVPGIELAARLTALVPAGLTRVFYSDSGATAVEVALKLAVQYWQLLGRTQKTRFARLEESYHGDTVGAMSVGYSDLFHHFHRDLLFPTLAVKPPYAYQREQGLGEAEAMARSVQEARDTVTREKERLAAFIMEPVMQGAAGMWPQPAGYVKAVRDICKDNDVLFIADEVATGFGHTGRMWACEHDGVSPDLMCVGKGITGGYLPLAATFATEEIFSAFLGGYGEFKSFFHGHTYTGNPLGCAVALASLDVFEQDALMETVPPKIAWLEDRIRKDILTLAHVRELRQRGFMTGIELVKDKQRGERYDPGVRIANQVVLEARRRGVIVRPLGDTLIMLPPLTISDTELETLMDVVRDSILQVTEAS